LRIFLDSQGRCLTQILRLFRDSSFSTARPHLHSTVWPLTARFTSSPSDASLPPATIPFPDETRTPHIWHLLFAVPVPISVVRFAPLACTTTPLQCLSPTAIRCLFDFDCIQSQPCLRDKALSDLLFLFSSCVEAVNNLSFLALVFLNETQLASVFSNSA
jgi:hypothetical protein